MKAIVNHTQSQLRHREAAVLGNGPPAKKGCAVAHGTQAELIIGANNPKDPSFQIESIMDFTTLSEVF